MSAASQERRRKRRAAERAFGSLLDSLVIAVAANAGHMVLGAKPPDDAASRRAAVEAAFAEVEAERDLERDKLRAVQSSVVHTIGGKVEGRPTHAGNYLQRLRALKAAESSASALRARVEALAKEWEKDAADLREARDESGLSATRAINAGRTAAADAADLHADALRSLLSEKESTTQSSRGDATP